MSQSFFTLVLSLMYKFGLGALFFRSVRIIDFKTLNRLLLPSHLSFPLRVPNKINKRSIIESLGEANIQPIVSATNINISSVD